MDEHTMHKITQCNLQKVLNRLVVERLIPHNQSAFCGVYGRNIKLFFPKKNDNYNGIFVKCSQDKGVANEFQTLRLVSKYFKGYAINPLRFIQEGNLYIVAYPLQRFKYIDPKKLDSKKYENQMVALFNRFFSQDQTFQEELKVSDETLINFFKHSDFSFFPLLQDYFLYSMQNIQKNYGKVAQHGDFAVNNLAIDSNSHVVLFDWEDYGKINYPFFDLASFMFSNALVQAKMEALSKNPNVFFDIPGARIATRACLKQGMSIKSFLKYFPFFIMLFIYLKQNLGYGDYIVNWLKKFLDQVSKSNEWSFYLRP